jgi:Zn-dependent peptidase ImmA (M78 family)
VHAVHREQREWLATNPAEAIPALTDLTVEICEPEEFGTSNCSAEGLYFSRRRHITAMRTGPRRTKFTLLHELGHDHARRTDQTAEALAGMGALSARFEERIADAFAAEILVPSADVEALLDG